VIYCSHIRAGNEDEVSAMQVSYKKLWKILIDKDMKKQDLQKATSISWGVITKLSKSETVSMEVLIKICRYLNCDIGDIIELLPEENMAAKE
jgi:DNA-binding Xre family transcriptional regulator